MSTAISVENVSKSYRLGTIGGATLKEDVSRWWAKRRGKPDPLLKVGDEHHARHIGEKFWALQNVSFEVQEGEVLGIIGRNGAGKSTLLKILSQVTAPTSGEIKIKGRIASLLEVGTGFHPELTGRENIFLNGAILGMTKGEIRRNFDKIVDFSGIEEFIDTPVKRYSSGMYVRLAFAVAAHLEPEILIVDEVLAVGDAVFQKKCLGKMQDVAHGGRTVLFVSHNMPAVSRLTHRCLVLQAGNVVLDGSTRSAIDHYMQSGMHSVSITRDVANAPRLLGGTQAATLLTLGFSGSTSSFRTGEDLSFDICLRANTKVSGLRFSITVFSADSTPIGTTCTREALELIAGELRQASIRLSQPRLAPGRYYCIAALGSGYCFEQRVDFDIVPDVLHFDIIAVAASSGSVFYWNDAWGKVVLPDMDMEEAEARAAE